MTHQEQATAHHRNAELRRLINRNLVVKDRGCFVKTDEERNLITRLKKTWDIRVKSGYKQKRLRLA